MGYSYGILVLDAPYMVRVPMNEDGMTITYVLHPEWDRHMLKFIKDNNIQVGEEIQKRILIPQWAESLIM